MKFSNVILADKNEIICLGIEALINEVMPSEKISIHKYLLNKTMQPEDLNNSLVVFDFEGSVFSSCEEFFLFAEKYNDVYWMLFSNHIPELFINSEYKSHIKRGALLKDCSANEVKRSILLASQNRDFHICPCICAQAATRHKGILTCTETEILALIASGLTTEQIAQSRSLSIHTVISHRKNIYKKLAVKNLQEATKVALKMKIIEID